ncbi:hypothetical protein BD413DRAFT_574890 [Trametes elegans]|nr:hypothetical protein BD413DRAFT_574890 [Trametes elegans]
MHTHRLAAAHSLLVTNKCLRSGSIPESLIPRNSAQAAAPIPDQPRALAANSMSQLNPCRSFSAHP